MWSWGSAALFAAMLVLAGCAEQPISVASSMVTSLEKVQLDKPASQIMFGLDEVVYIVVYLTWPDVTANGGNHKAEWNWYREGQLVSHAQARIRLIYAPADRHTSRPASALGVGHYSVDTVLDGKVISTDAFTIKT